MDFQTLEPRNLLAAVVVSTADDLVSPTADTSSIASLIANDGGDGISLREAIAAANNSAGEDTVTFAASVFTGGDNSLVRLTQGELSISENLTIDGSSVGGVVITGDANDDDITLPGTHITDVSASFGGTAVASDDLLDDNSRVLNFLNIGNLNLTDLTVTGGRVSGGDEVGGGIRFGFRGTLSLNQSIVSGNSTEGFSGRGGGISTNFGDVSLTNSTVSGNSTAGQFANGGGISTVEGAVSLTNSAVIGNSTTGDSADGGGIGTRSGAVTLANSVVSGNSSGDNGGGISAPSVSLTDSSVSGNSSVDYGGGVNTGFGDVSAVNSTVTGNTSGRYGGGIRSRNLLLTNSAVSGNHSVEDGGGILISSGDVSLTNSTVSGNTSGGDGAGIRIRGGNVSFVNSTISMNTSDGDGGGALFYSSAVLLVNSTVTGNSASGIGGGIEFRNIVSNDDERLTLQNSIVAGNLDNGTAPDLSTDFVDAVDLIVEHSLIGNTTGSEVSAATGTGNILNQMPLLGPLADNGGPTQTHDLLAGSLALNAGSNTLVNATGVTTDQRGVDRILSGSVDIGALEVDVEARLIVTTEQDVEDQTDGVTSLREAIALANENISIDKITFDPSVFNTATTINVLSQLPTITDVLTITGPGANLLVIDAQGGGDIVLDGNGFRIFDVNDGDLNNSIDVSIRGLTLTGGDIGDSGGAIKNFENLTLDRVAIVGNRAGFGGGVSNEPVGEVTITNSTIANNEASQNGGGVFTLGAFAATGVTISGNSASADGGGIVVAGNPSGAKLNLTHSTLANNSGNGGVFFDGGDGPAVATFNNTIIDDSITGVGNDDSTLAGGNNLFANSDPGISGTGNLFNQTVKLGPLADNGGSTLTHALLLGSPAFNAGSITLAVGQNGNQLISDQRGERRIQFGAVDIGAVETEFDVTRSLIVTTTQDVVDPLDGFNSLREAIAFANDPTSGNNNDGDADSDGLIEDTITFDASVFTGGDNSLIRLTQGELSISESLVIDGTSVVGVVITGDADADDITLTGSHITDVSASFGGTLGASDDLLDDNNRVLDFTARSGDLTLEGLTITGGRLNNAAVGYMGGGGVRFGGRLFSSGTLTLNQSTVIGNSASGLGGSRLDGGGIQSYSGNILLNNSTVSGNYSILDGGGIRTDEGNVSLTDSIVVGNISERSGGGILTDEGDISLTNSEVSENVSGDGGGGLQARGDILLTGSTVSGNVAGRIGGGIRASNGAVSLNDSIVSGNSSEGIGGGIGAFGASITLINSTVSGNDSGSRGGGIGTSTGDVSLTNSTVSGNTSSGDGGGIRAGNILLTNSAVSGNTSGGDGGGISTTSRDVSLTNSTVNDNSSNSDQGSQGGGIRTLTGNVSLADSTISGNRSTGNGSNGGGISSDSGIVTLINSTLSDNLAAGDFSNGGGIGTDSGSIS
ncbi:hypothetical protein OAG71_03985, partial [bacterium]|nr:hypothetical protein [bacterium]